ncbi:hypothetical protein [Gallibacterium anatis]|uniref:hypothetical protein n=1 Tax=Gallibacterium anatis TaxID=750 RepID=UPI00254B5E14|nr:hypothetical protein [Gallibacterium anatis]WIM82209.1 hypothetical protein QP019_00570 [Gallibacterium anatis]WIM82282.1 hypothetical protein QP019_00945 [Gallibacterium anatis]
MNTILISALTALTVSLLVHWFTVTQVTKWFDNFFEEETKTLEKYAKDIEKIVKERLEKL